MLSASFIRLHPTLLHRFSDFPIIPFTSRGLRFLLQRLGSLHEAEINEDFMSLRLGGSRRGRRERLAHISQQSTQFLLKLICYYGTSGAAVIELKKMIKKAIKEADPADSGGLRLVSAARSRCLDAAGKQETTSRRRICPRGQHCRSASRRPAAFTGAACSRSQAGDEWPTGEVVMATLQPEPLWQQQQPWRPSDPPLSFSPLVAPFGAAFPPLSVRRSSIVSRLALLPLLPLLLHLLLVARPLGSVCVAAGGGNEGRRGEQIAPRCCMIMADELVELS